jgi:hypothetical protein
MRALAPFLMLGLSSCATSVSELGQDAPSVVFQSNRTAEAVATCLVTSLRWDNQLVRMGDGHFVVSRNSAYGSPLFRWDFFDTETGSRAELRTGVGLGGSGEQKARECAA